jgi:phosphate transport system substrate-binding protein
MTRHPPTAGFDGIFGKETVQLFLDFRIGQDRVRLPMIGIDRGHSFKLVIVLSGTKAGETYPVVVEGGLRQGRITTQEDRETIRPDTLVWGGLTAICAGAFAMVLLLNNITPVI